MHRNGWRASCIHYLGMDDSKTQSASWPSSRTTATLLAEALRLHQKGALGEAQGLYEKILSIDAHHCDALHLSGVALYQRGDYENAERHIRKAIARDERVASYHANLGLVLEAKAQRAAAQREYLRAIQLQSSYAEAYLNLGNLYLVEGCTEDAIEILKKLLEQYPDYAKGHNSLGSAYKAQGQYALAAHHFRQALGLQPTYQHAHCNLGSVLQQMGALQEAAVCFRDALRLQPNSVEALNLTGILLRENGEAQAAIGYHERAVKVAAHKAESLVLLARAEHAAGHEDRAIELCDAAVRAQPDYVPAYGEWANLLHAQKNFQAAKSLLQKALVIDAGYAEAYNTLGVIAEEQGQLEAARDHLEKALSLRPVFPEAENNLGLVAWSQGRFEDARAAYARSLSVRPDYSEARWNLALSQLIDGEYGEGWRNYEARWQRARAPRSFAQPLWQGEPLADRRILLHAEQGLGDTLQFLRFVPQVVAAGGKVILDVQRRVVPLAQELAGVETVVAEGQPHPEFDLHCPLMSLPLVLGVTFDRLPAEVPYLRVPAASLEKARRVDWPEDGALRVGLSWTGSTKNALNPKRSILLKELAPLFDLEGIHFYSLQMSQGAEQWHAYRDAVVDLGGSQNHLGDAAAIIEQLDLVISVDTMVAHLAGALGRPCWTLLPFVPDWRWMRGREDSPWYPTMRLFRQTEPGNWAAVVAAVRGALVELCDEAAPQRFGGILKDRHGRLQTAKAELGVEGFLAGDRIEKDLAMAGGELH